MRDCIYGTVFACLLFGALAARPYAIVADAAITLAMVGMFLLGCAVGASPTERV